MNVHSFFRLNTLILIATALQFHIVRRPKARVPTRTCVSAQYSRIPTPLLLNRDLGITPRPRELIRFAIKRKWAKAANVGTRAFLGHIILASVI